MYTLGIDVGGTHIDYAVVDEKNRLVYGHKILAEGDLAQAIAQGLRDLEERHRFDLRQLRDLHLGTTLAMNSLLELRSLYKVGLLRLAGHAPDFPPAYGWPEAHRSTILAASRTVAGGREYNNQCCKPLQRDTLLRAVDELLAAGAESLAVVGVFSPLYAEDELLAADWIRKEISPTLPVSLSSQLGSLGYIVRENTTLLNAALKKVLKKGFNTLLSLLKDLGFQGECQLTQNNGTLLTLDEALEYPVKTLVSGPTNSLSGACKLAQVENAVVVDIGGTSTDLGVVENGFPVYSLKGGNIAGIACNLLAAEITALAMGGGSLVRYQAQGFTVGPESVGAALFKMCTTYGGNHLTVYDLAQILSKTRNPQAEAVLAFLVQKIKDEAQALVPESARKPILLVGGGSANIPDYLMAADFIRPPHYPIANAYGAALAEVSGQIDCLVQLKAGEDGLLQDLEEKAKMLALQKGAAASSLRIIEKKVLPLSYLDEPLYRVLITAAGRKALSPEYQRHVS